MFLERMGEASLNAGDLNRGKIWCWKRLVLPSETLESIDLVAGIQLISAQYKARSFCFRLSQKD